ncbi:hypothetical protein [Cupriavidus basilensis]|uniref:hypothetical protein n=1 Tax=Cupriavidus basilensis TaxID=68895 RepID=UPI0020A68A89|nr:hypothetical protein [Cupriavidus basilensis]MCP3023247.1 hypothetical protein [Cupriavidus basilensis]
MTTILVDRGNREVWSDSRLSDGHMKVGAKKVYKTKRVIVGLAGDLSLLAPLRRLVNGDLDAGALLVKEDFEGFALYPTGRLMLFGQSPHPVEVTDRYIAIGSGGMAAMASIETQALQGAEPDLELALRVACAIDQATGEPIVRYGFT